MKTPAGAAQRVLPSQVPKNVGRPVRTHRSIQPAKRKERSLPPEPTRAGDDAAMAAVAQMAPVVVPVVEMPAEVPAEEIPGTGAPEWFEDLEEVDPNAAANAAARVADFVSASEDSLGAGPSEGPVYGINWATIQPRVPSGFTRNERWEDDVWKEQDDVGTLIEAALTRALQLHKTTNFSISNVSAYLVTYPFLIVFIWLPLTSFYSHQLMQRSRDKSVELAQQYSRVNWLERYNANLIAWLGVSNTLVSDLGA